MSYKTKALLIDIAARTLRLFAYVALTAIAAVASIVCLCCYDPEQPGMVCDHPGLCLGMLVVIAACIGGIAAIYSASHSDSKL